jgi:hypothetical protein
MDPPEATPAVYATAVDERERRGIVELICVTGRSWRRLQERRIRE